ncbi:AgmX/PglI C-terminal domain-containing protein [Malonomonas rubra]|uniref:AgmX/PglI C-terminal domain-containing protein n=1 Tax=Malonomonas rubra TaxID=57040 RepID=UPI0026ED5F80|nr:AgmX/PglI C-terminal domain-containing protein [Malonomonas rubra]
MNTSILSQELEPLNERIEELKQAVVMLEGELCGVETELENFATDQQHFDILQETCTALERLKELGAGELFWEGLTDENGAVEHAERMRTRIAAFREETRTLYEQKAALQESLDENLLELDELFEEVRQAYGREERRQEEFVIEREISFFTYRPALMPWSNNAESERRFRRVLLISLFWSLVLSIVIPLVNVPLPDRNTEMLEIPERLAMLVKQEPPMVTPPPVPEKPQKEEKIDPEQEKPIEPKKAADEPKKASQKAKPAAKPKSKSAGGETKLARQKAEQTGVLAFKSSFSDLMDEVPVAKLGTEARLKKTDPRIPGQARAQRSLVAKQAAGGGSGGISNYAVSRNLGNGGTGGGNGYGNAGQIGGVGTAKVDSSLADLTEEQGRPLSDGVGAGRTDEEIQIVFDRYKATLYRIYNKELRNDPTLRGKLLLRIIIEPGGEVSFCKVESTDLASPELVTSIVARVMRFNFGPKEDVPKTTILYPIDFLPAS